MTVYLFEWQAGSFVIATSDAGAECAAVGTVVKAGGATSTQWVLCGAREWKPSTGPVVWL
jgi:hypothetical protein